MDRELLTVVIPCRNEEEGIAPTVAEILGHAPSLPVDVEVLLIDDGSTDGTRRRMEELAAAHATCRLIVNDRNLGMGRSVIRAYDEVPAGSWVTALPGDHELTFESIDNFLAVRDRYDLILGYLQNPVIRTFRRRLASWAFTRIVSLLYGFQWRYLNGMKMYRAEVFKGLEVVSSGHAFMAEAIAKAQLRWPQVRIGEVAFAARGRARGASKAIRPGSVLRAVRDVARGARSVARYRERVVKGCAGP
jgi:glycosyltransferase involved in cell wall biosynthesis